MDGSVEVGSFAGERHDTARDWIKDKSKWRLSRIDKSELFYYGQVLKDGTKEGWGDVIESD